MATQRIALALGRGPQGPSLLKNPSARPKLGATQARAKSTPAVAVTPQEKVQGLIRIILLLLTKNVFLMAHDNYYGTFWDKTKQAESPYCIGKR